MLHVLNLVNVVCTVDDSNELYRSLYNIQTYPGRSITGGSAALNDVKRTINVRPCKPKVSWPLARPLDMGLYLG